MNRITSYFSKLSITSKVIILVLVLFVLLRIINNTTLSYGGTAVLRSATDEDNLIKKALETDDINICSNVKIGSFTGDWSDTREEVETACIKTFKAATDDKNNAQTGYDRVTDSSSNITYSYPSGWGASGGSDENCTYFSKLYAFRVNQLPFLKICSIGRSSGTDQDVNDYIKSLGLPLISTWKANGTKVSFVGDIKKSAHFIFGKYNHLFEAVYTYSPLNYSQYDMERTLNTIGNMTKPDGMVSI